MENTKEPRERRGAKKGSGSRRAGPKRPVSDIEHRVVDMRRVTRVVAGGRRFTFRATVVAGNRKGLVGVGVAKGRDTALSIEKALNKARQSFITVPITDEGTIPYDVTVKYGPSRLTLRPGRKGRGLVAGSSVRTVMELAGIENISAKLLSRSSNKLNNARVALFALGQLRTRNHKKHATSSHPSRT